MIMRLRWIVISRKKERNQLKRRKKAVNNTQCLKEITSKIITI